MNREQREVLDYILVRMCEINLPSEHYWGLGIIADRIIMNNPQDFLPELRNDTKGAET